VQSPSILADIGQKTAEGTTMNGTQRHSELPAILPDLHGGFGLCPTVMTEQELIRFLRIPEISSAGNHRHVIENLKRKHGLPRIHLCGKTLYLTDSVKQWLQQRVTYSN
jgi:hypothetical protein